MNITELCVKCGKNEAIVIGCCSGFECGCMGMPVSDHLCASCFHEEEGISVNELDAMREDLSIHKREQLLGTSMLTQGKS